MFFPEMVRINSKLLVSQLTPLHKTYVGNAQVCLVRSWNRSYGMKEYSPAQFELKCDSKTLYKQ